MYLVWAIKKNFFKLIKMKYSTISKLTEFIMYAAAFAIILAALCSCYTRKYSFAIQENRVEVKNGILYFIPISKPEKIADSAINNKIVKRIVKVRV